jgi:hypothetical protein
VEYPIEINDRLGGSLNYLIRSNQDLIVVEAKKGDLDKGFNQLAAELIALDQYEEGSSAFGYFFELCQTFTFSLINSSHRKSKISKIFRSIPHFSGTFWMHPNLYP